MNFLPNSDGRTERKMKIGSIFDSERQLKTRYSYKKRGMDELFLPDMVCEPSDCGYYTNEFGNLFFGKEVAWYGANLLDGGIDIHIDMFGRCYADHADFAFGHDTGMQSIEIITKENGKEKIIGVCMPQSGKNITDSEVTIPIGAYCDNLIIRINGACFNVSLQKIDIFGAWDLEDSIYPLAEKADFTGEKFIIDDSVSVSANGEDAKSAVLYFEDKFAEKYGKNINAGNGKRSIEFVWENREDDRFKICCANDSCIIKGGKRGLLYAADALMQLTDGKTIKGCIIEDTPFMNFRGVHLALPERDQIEFLHRMVKYVFVPMRYNAVILQIAGAMRYDAFPEINEMWAKACENYEKGEWPLPAHYGFVGRDILEKSEVADLCAFFRKYGMEVIPEVQSWSHCQYITTAYPELAEEESGEKIEKNMFVADDRPETFYKHSMCPLHPRYYDVIFKITEEVLEVVKPERFVHMGHDEIYQVGICEKCKQHDGGELYANEVTKLNDFVRSHGLTMMLWADMVQEKHYSTYTAVNKIPKNIIMLDFTWYFHFDGDIEDNLLSHGFEVILGNMYSSHFPRYERRSKKKGIIGAEVSTWVACTEKTYSFKGKMYDFVYSANCLWNKNYDSSMRLTYDEIIRSILFDIRKKIGNINLTGEEKTISFKSDKNNIPNALQGVIPYEGAAVCSKDHDEIEIEVNGYADLFTAVHTTDKSGGRELWKDAVKIGEYIIEYEDGTKESEDIRYGDNIYKFSSRFGMPLESPVFRHEGYVASYMSKPESYKDIYGNDCTLLKCFIKNPHKDKKIRLLKVKASGNTDAEIILFDVKKIG